MRADPPQSRSQAKRKSSVLQGYSMGTHAVLQGYSSGAHSHCAVEPERKGRRACASSAQRCATNAFSRADSAHF